MNGDSEDQGGRRKRGKRSKQNYGGDRVDRGRKGIAGGSIGKGRGVAGWRKLEGGGGGLFSALVGVNNGTRPRLQNRGGGGGKVRVG